MGITDERRSAAFVLACCAAGGAVIGAVGTWKAGFQSSESGTDGAALYTLGLGIFAGLVLLRSSKDRGWEQCLVAMLCGLLILGIGVVHLVDLSGAGPLGTDPADPGWGLWLTVFSGASLAVSSLVLILARKSPAT